MHSLFPVNATLNPCGFSGSSVWCHTIFGITTHLPFCPLAYFGLFQLAEAYTMFASNSGSLNVKCYR